MAVISNIKAQQAQASAFTRVNAMPLDTYEIFNSLKDAEDYANDNPVSYAGQIITVVIQSVAAVTHKATQADVAASKASAEGDTIIDTPAVEGSITPYQIQEDGSLKNILAAGSDASDILLEPWEEYDLGSD